MRPAIWITGLIAMLAAACSKTPDTPGEAEARAWYRQHRDTVQGIEQTLRDEVARLQLLSGKPLPCESAAAPAAGTDPVPEAAAGADCAAQKLALLEQHNEAVARFRAEVLPALLERPSVLGARVQYTLPTAKTAELLGSIGLTPPGYGNGTTRAAQGVSEDGKNLGWGLYQTAFQAGNRPRVGDEAYRPGIELAWSFAHGPTHLEVELFLLATDSTSAEWRAAWKAAAAP